MVRQDGIGLEMAISERERERAGGREGGREGEFDHHVERRPID